jgi:hypothetical protein
MISAVNGRAFCLLDCFTLQLTAGSGNVIASRTANIDLQPIRGKNLLEALDVLGFRPLIMAALMRIEGD